MTDESKPKKASLVAVIRRLPRFLWHLVKDRRVPWMVKAALVGMALYLAMPFDLIPDWIPGVGYLDDILIVAAVVNYVFAKLPHEVIVEHWGEDVEALEVLKRRKRTKGG